MPANQEVQIGKLVVKASKAKKLERPPYLYKNLGVVVLACHPSYVGGINSKITV
jgi:hypothetical protein